MFHWWLPHRRWSGPDSQNRGATTKDKNTNDVGLVEHCGRVRSMNLSMAMYGVRYATKDDMIGQGSSLRNGMAIDKEALSSTSIKVSYAAMVSGSNRPTS
ncbi:hypothetical protein V6N13_009478 [Hibiscus sabdariffa]|uniref:Uncharacterized protein n=1 Tax=Hibiscus sabdariffa TaxID=183260 RepID=A0ABR2PPC6_9ROSI